MFLIFYISSVEGQNPGQTLANLDTGTALATIPSFYAQAIYGNVPGAQLDRASGNILLPCDTQLNVSFIFGYVYSACCALPKLIVSIHPCLYSGVEIPIHPIDTVQAASDGQGGVICLAGFPVSDPDPNEPGKLRPALILIE